MKFFLNHNVVFIELNWVFSKFLSFKMLSLISVIAKEVIVELARAYCILIDFLSVKFVFSRRQKCLFKQKIGPILVLKFFCIFIVKSRRKQVVCRMNRPNYFETKNCLAIECNIHCTMQIAISLISGKKELAGEIAVVRLLLPTFACILCIF